MKQLLLLSSFIGCLFLSPLSAEDRPIDGYVIQYDVMISSSKIWTSWDGDEHTYLFTFSDGSRWVTSNEKDFRKVKNSQWRSGDHLCIQLTDEGWMAKNTERNNSVPLQQICNKGADS